MNNCWLCFFKIRRWQIRARLIIRKLLLSSKKANKMGIIDRIFIYLCLRINYLHIFSSCPCRRGIWIKIRSRTQENYNLAHRCLHYTSKVGARIFKVTLLLPAIEYHFWLGHLSCKNSTKSKKISSDVPMANLQFSWRLSRFQPNGFWLSNLRNCILRLLCGSWLKWIFLLWDTDSLA
jgi:hypothetical protein